MPYADHTYDAPATYSFTFEYLDADAIKVDVNGVTKKEGTNEDYTIANSVVTFNTGKEPATDDKVRIYRATDLETPKATFYPGSAIRSQDLNANNDQVLFSSQETNHDALNRFGKNTIEGDIDVGGNRLTNLKDEYTGIDNELAAPDNDAASHGWVRQFFFDVKAETITDNEYIAAGQWPQNNATVGTTAAIKEFVKDELAGALTGNIHSEDGVRIDDNDPGAGQITIGLSEGLVDLDRIKPANINTASDTTYTSGTGSTAWESTDDQVPTLAAVAKRHDTILSANQPTSTDYAAGTFWFSKSGGTGTENEGGETLTDYLAIWNGTAWMGVAGGGTWLNQTGLIWVDAGNGSDQNDGRRVIKPMKTIQGAVNSAVDGDMIFVQPGVYKEYLPIDLGHKKNVSIIGLSMRSVFVHPDPEHYWEVTSSSAAFLAPEEKVLISGPRGNRVSGTSEHQTMFKLGSGSFVASLTLAGMKASGTRGDTSEDSEATDQGWFFGFSEKGSDFNKLKFQKSPYVQNVSAFADSSIDNHNFDPHLTEGQPSFAGDTSSGMTGGGLLVDGNAPHGDSPLRSFLTDAYTIICLDGPGVLVKNDGYAQLASTFGHFTHYHAKVESGGMINMSNCTTDFGRFGLIADGQSSSAVFDGKINGSVTSGLTIAVDDLAAHEKPASTMVLRYANDATYYPIKSATNTGTSSTIELFDPITVANDQNVYFYNRSIITSGGHTFEFTGAGTDYTALPSNGGEPDQSKQVEKLNDGAIYITSTDNQGNFKVSDVFHVNTDAETVEVDGTFNATTVKVNGVETKSTSTFFESNNVIKDASLPDKVTAGSATNASVTVDAKGRVTTLNSGTAPVTEVTVASGSPVTITAGTTPEIDIETFAGESQKGIVVNTATDGTNDDKFLKGDGTWDDPATASYNISAAQSSTDVDVTLGGNSTSTIKVKAGPNIELTRNSAQEFEIKAPLLNAATVNIDSTVPSSPGVGNMWWDKATGESYIYYDDGDSSQWVQFAPQQRGTGNGTVTSIQVTGGTGLSVDNASAVVTSGSFELSLDDTAVTAGTYGDADSVAQFTVDAQGRVTAASNVDITLDPSSIEYGSGTSVWDSANSEFEAAVIPEITGSMIQAVYPSHINLTSQYGYSTEWTAYSLNTKTIEWWVDPTNNNHMFVKFNLGYDNEYAIGNDRIHFTNFVLTDFSTGITDPGGTAEDWTLLRNLIQIGGPGWFVVDATEDDFTIRVVKNSSDTWAFDVTGQYNDRVVSLTLTGGEYNPWPKIDSYYIPPLHGAAITEGLIDKARIPTLDKSQISTTGTWAVGDIPTLPYIADLVSDTNPVLGANLDLGVYDITTTSNNRDIKLSPDGSGRVVLENDSGVRFKVKNVNNNNDYTVDIKPSSTTALSQTYWLPTNNGQPGDILSVSGGALSWVEQEDHLTSIAGSDDNGDFRIRLTEDPNVFGSSTTDTDIKLKAGDGVTLTTDPNNSNDCTISVAAVPTGAIMWWPIATMPTGWIECDGRALLMSAYSALHSRLGNAYENHRNSAYPAGTYPTTTHFMVPDLRGQFIRGQDVIDGNAKYLDSEAGGRSLGTFQDPRITDHTHGVTAYREHGMATFGSGQQQDVDGNSSLAVTLSTSSVNDPSNTIVGETRPYNVSLIPIIKT